MYDSTLMFGGPDTAWFLHLSIVKGAVFQDHPSRFSLATNTWFDIKLINFWKGWCMGEHGQICNNPWKIHQIRPAWLIDTHRSCLVPGEDGVPYICLSYQWGKVPRYRTRKAELPSLLEPGSFEQIEIKNRLPPIVSQTMQLVRDMEERYLWADTLCILQDDEVSKATEMDRMGDIYGSALLTIVAANGDGEYGLPDVPGALARIPTQCTFTFKGQPLARLSGNWCGDVTWNTQYTSRAWAFQEYGMSPRKLIFANDRVHWACNCAEWDEQRPMRNAYHFGPRL